MAPGLSWYMTRDRFLAHQHPHRYPARLRPILLSATALAGSLVMTPVLMTPALAADVTNTNGDTSPGSLGAAVLSGEQFINFNDLGAAATINLAAPVNFTLGFAAVWQYNGTTTSVTVGGNDIVADSHLYFFLDAGEDLTLNSDLTLSGPGGIALASGGGTVTFNGDISNIGRLSINNGSTAVVGTTTSATLIDIQGNSTLRFDTAGSYTSNIEIRDAATIDTGAHNVSISGAVTDDGANTLVKTGSGTLTLSGTNTASGTMRIDAGTLSIAADGNISAGTLTLNGGNLTVTDTTTIDNAVALSSNATIANSADVALSGAISGTGTLTKAGAGTLTLTGTNANSGGTTISAGTLQIGDGGTSGQLPGDVVNNSALIFNRSDSMTYAGVISGTGSLTQSGRARLS
ncbi:MAG: autotransporter-associated beta strand repeat-containing protein [Oricola sp.]